MPRLLLDIARYPIAVSIPSARLAARARRRYRYFLGRGRPRLSLDLALAPPGLPHPLPMPRVEARGGGALRVARRGDFDVTFAAGRGAGRVRGGIIPLDNLLRVTHAAMLLRRGGLLVHGAGIRVGRRAWVFPSRSGGGKSTLAALAGAERVLSDELTALRAAGRRPMAMGTPFWGSFEEGRVNATVPLAGLAFLRRAPRPFVRPIAPDEAARRLMKVTMFFETGLDAHRRLLAVVHRLVHAVPTVELAFDKRRPIGEVERALEERD